jgi:hypothetical protein
MGPRRSQLMRRALGVRRVGGETTQGADRQPVTVAFAVVCATYATFLAWVPWILALPGGRGGGTPAYTAFVDRHSGIFFAAGVAVGTVVFLLMLLRYLPRGIARADGIHGWRGLISVLAGLVAFPSIVLLLAAPAADHWGHAAAAVALLCLLAAHLVACTWAFSVEMRRRAEAEN